MTRVRRGYKARRRRNALKKLAKGYHSGRRQNYRRMAETITRALEYTTIARKLFKRERRRLWITRISATAKTLGSSYSSFMGQLSRSGCTLNRKMLAEMAARDFQNMKFLYQQVMGGTKNSSLGAPENTSEKSGNKT